MKGRWMALGVAIGLALALTLGSAFASDRSTPTPDRGSATALAQTDPWTDMQGMQGMQAMHDSPAMQRLHAQMPEELQAQCDAMHVQMGQMMGGDMSSHHEGVAGGGMMAPGSVGSGGMMGGGPGTMMGS